MEDGRYMRPSASDEDHCELSEAEATAASVAAAASAAAAAVFATNGAAGGRSSTSL